METLVRKYIWAVDLVVIAIAATFLARAAASAIESTYLLEVTPPRAAARVLPVSAPAVYTKQIDDILKRNVFCSTCPPIGQPDAGATTTTVPDLQRTSLPLALMAVMFAPPPHDQRWSMAIIRDTETKGTGPFAVGMKIREATVSHIEETRIYLDNAGRPEYLDLFEKEVATAALGPKPSITAPQDDLSRQLAAGIKKTGDKNFEVQRSALDAVLGNMSMLSRSARIVPEIRDGKPAGFRLYSVRPDGPFAQIGLQNGDVIYAINGLEMTSPDKALEVYTKLKSASHLSVAFERGGQKQNMDYNIR